MMFCVRLLSKLMILLSAHHLTKPSDLSQQVDIAYELKFDPKNMRILYQKYQKIQFCIQ